MKKLSLILGILALNYLSFAQSDTKKLNQSAIEHANFYIEGYWSATKNTGKGYTYKLDNISSKGIDFANHESIQGTQSEVGSYVVFQFNNAKTQCSESFENLSNRLKFYTWDPDNEMWNPKPENKVGETKFRDTKSMMVMLVLDCSNSMGFENLQRVKESAKSFLKTLYDAANGAENIHAGVIGFNTNLKESGMMVLNENNYKKLRDFIDNLSMENLTKMYSAIHKASKTMDNYLKTNAKLSESMDGAFLITFTDGFDNASQDEEIGMRDDYLQYIHNNIVNRNVGKTKLECHLIVFPGLETSQREIDKLPLLASGKDKFVTGQMNAEGEFVNINNIFAEIAKNLVNRWTDLTCFIPPSYDDGKVRWVLSCSDVIEKEEPEKKVKPSFNPKQIIQEGDKKIEIGLSTITINGLSVKTITPSNFGMEFDFGASFYKSRDNKLSTNMEFNANAMYQGNFSSDLFWFAGAGLSIGLSLKGDGLLLGINPIAGVEYKINNTPLSLQFDIRPKGFILLDYKSKFRWWGFNLSLRYCL